MDKKDDDKKVDDKKVEDKKEDKKEDVKDDKKAKDAKKSDNEKPDDKKDATKDTKNDKTSDDDKKSKDGKKSPVDGKSPKGDEKPAEYVNFGGAGEDEDPYENDEKTKKDHFRETFITQDKGKKELASLFTMHDMMIPAGRTSKLVRVPDPNNEDFRVTEPLDKLKFTEPTPVIILAGAMGDRAGKTLAGVARAAFRAGACIIDSGVGSGIEKFCMRKSVPLIGVCPENEISYPVNSQNKKENELTNGHTHFFLTGSDESKKNFKWGEEAKLKAEIAKRIAKGRTKYGGSFTCKIVVVVVGDNTQCTQDLLMAKENQFPIIVLEGSQFCADIIASKGGLPEDDDQEDHKANKDGEGDAEDNIGGAKKESGSAPEGGQIRDSELSQLVSDEKIYLCKQNSEHIANITHLLLTVTL
jgi:hypothetical protein